MMTVFLSCVDGRCMAVYRTFREALEHCLTNAQDASEVQGRVETLGTGANVRWPKNTRYHVEEHVVFGSMNQEEEVK